ncbi:MAG: class I SAM-dependent methyltransferase [Candidatus Omnitrophica bacterium]|nr:class I SAM-dependent methyltransferase [Candidatus Omnitrophota bacterium]
MSKKNSKNSTLSCPSCKNISIQYIGEIPLTTIFAGQIVAEHFAKSCLYRCEHCFLHFRWPRPTKQQLYALYKKNQIDNQQNKTMHRRDWKIASRLISEYEGQKTILDIGCGDGSFLNYVGKDWKRYGVELNEKLAAEAEAQGVHIVQTDFDTLATIKQSFGVVMALNVIEHTEDPVSFFKHMMGLTAAGGIVIISTGNTLALSWRFMGSKYWYCSLNDHISFINRSWCQTVSKEFQMPIVSSQQFSYFEAQLFLSGCADIMKNAMYKVLPSFFCWLRKKGFGGIDVDKYPDMHNSPPSWHTAKDHMMVVFRNNKAVM